MSEAEHHEFMAPPIAEIHKVDRCPRCGHAPHDPRGCSNIASDEGCDCYGETVSQSAPERINAEMLLAQMRFIPDVMIKPSCESRVLELFKTALVNARADGRDVALDRRLDSDNKSSQATHESKTSTLVPEGPA